MQSDTPEKDLRAAGLRLTPTRLKIFDILKKSSGPISVGQIVDHLSAHKTTVYREITSLLQSGFISEVNVGDRKKWYELTSKSHHHHLVCINCSCITEVDLQDDLTPQEQAVSKNNGFKVLRHSLEFFGLCKSCNLKGTL